MAFRDFDMQVNIGSDLSGLEAGLAQAQRDMRRAAGAMQSLGTQMSVAITAPLVAIGGAAAKSAADLDQLFGQVQAQAGLTESQIQSIKQASLELGSETGEPISEIAEGFKFATSQGMELAKAQELVRQSSMAAASGFGNQKDLVRATTTAMEVYGDALEDPKNLMDTVIANAQNMQAEVSSVGKALGRVAGPSAELGVSLDETLAGLGAVSENFNDINRGSRAFSRLILRTVNPTEQASEKISELFGSMENFRDLIRQQGLLPAMVELRQAMEDQGGSIADVFEASNIAQAALALTNRRAERAKQIMSDSSDAVDANKEAYEDADNVYRTFRQEVNKLRGGLDELGGRLIDVAEEEIPTLGDKIGGLLEDFNQLSEKQQKGIIKQGAIAAAAGPAIAIIGTLGAVALNALASMSALFGSTTLLAGALFLVGDRALKAASGVSILEQAAEGLKGTMKLAKDQSVSFAEAWREAWSGRTRFGGTVDFLATMSGLQAGSFAFTGQSVAQNMGLTKDQDELDRIRNTDRLQGPLDQQMTEKTARALARGEGRKRQGRRQEEFGRIDDKISDLRDRVSTKENQEEMKKESMKREALLKNITENLGSLENGNMQALERARKQLKQLRTKGSDALLKDDRKEQERESRAMEHREKTQEEKLEAKIEKQTEKFEQKLEAMQDADLIDISGSDIRDLSEKKARSNVLNQFAGEFSSLLDMEGAQESFNPGDVKKLMNRFDQATPGSLDNTQAQNAKKKREIIKIVTELEGEKLTEEVVEKIGDEVRRLNNEGRF